MRLLWRCLTDGSAPQKRNLALFWRARHSAQSAQSVYYVEWALCATSCCARLRTLAVESKPPIVMGERRRAGGEATGNATGVV